MPQKKQLVPIDPEDALTGEEEAELEAESTSDATVILPEQAEAKPAETSEQQAQPDAEQPQQAEGKEPSKAQQRIQALVEERNRERERTQQLQEELAKQREQWARLDERRRQSQELQEQATRQAEAARQQAQRPDPDVDPQGAALWDLRQQVAQQNAQLQQFQSQFQQQGQQTQQEMARAAVTNYLNNDYMRVQAVKPDIQSAVEHLRAKRITHYEMMGYPQQRTLLANGQQVPSAADMWESERQAYVVQAMQNGRSVNEIAYQLAVDTGYQPPQANGNATAQPVQAQVNGRERVQQISQAMKMQGLGGRVAQGEADALAPVKSMTTEQFAKWVADMPEDQFLDMPNTNPQLWAIVGPRMIELG